MTTSQDLTGVWTANLEKSTLLGPPPKSITATIRYDDADLAVALLITMPDGVERRVVFAGPTDGTEFVNRVGAQEWRSRMRWIGKELMIESSVEIGEEKLHLRDYWLLSEDGQSLTMEHRDDDLRGQITVLDRVLEW